MPNPIAVATHAGPVSLASLTGRQRQVYEAIRRLSRRHGCSPSLRELAAEMGIALNAAAGHVKVLSRKGVLCHDAGRGRSIRLLAGRTFSAYRHNGEVVLDCGDRVYRLDDDAARSLARQLAAVVAARVGGRRASV